MESLSSFSSNLGSSISQVKMPVVFAGHGSPMNAVEQNEFSKGWQEIAKELPEPTAILCISAHWETRGTFVTAMERPKTIHDFYGFPQQLFDLQYPALGSPELANHTIEAVEKTQIEKDLTWGLDHGCWSILQHMYPAANIPVVQLSLNQLQDPLWHYQLAQELNVLRNKGVLIIGSGNMVHNLGVMNWKTPEKGYDWAEEANQRLKKLITNNDHLSLANYKDLGAEVRQSIPTPEHYLPLLYILGLKADDEKVQFFNDKTVFGSISMTSLLIGN
jgi:4,5-DOPA dioxygenase extradiol